MAWLMRALSIPKDLALFATLLIVALVGIVFILAGIIVEEGWSGGAFLNDLGTAFLIAAVVAFAVERYLRDRLYADIQKQIADSLVEHRQRSIDAILFQRRLTPEIGDLVRRTVIEQPIIQRNLREQYDMQIEDSDEGEVLRTSVISTSVLENVTDQLQTTRYEEWGGAFEFLEFTVKGLDGDFEDATHVSTDNIEPYVYEKPGYVVFSREVIIPARTSVSIYLKWQVDYDLDDMVSVSCDRPTIGLSVTVTVAPDRFTFTGRREHPVEQQWSGLVNNESGRHRWSIEGGLLPSQGLVFEWRPRREGELAAP